MPMPMMLMLLNIVLATVVGDGTCWPIFLGRPAATMVLVTRYPGVRLDQSNGISSILLNFHRFELKWVGSFDMLWLACGFVHSIEMSSSSLNSTKLATWSCLVG